jgi:hypothetical protein
LIWQLKAAYGSQRNLCISHRKGGRAVSGFCFVLFFQKNHYFGSTAAGNFFRDIPGMEWASFNKDILGQTCICEAKQKVKDLHYDDTLTTRG